MATPRHLRKAPITEAIIDLRVKARKDFRVESFNDARGPLAAEFPNVEERKSLQTVFEFKVATGESASPITRDLGIQGLFFKSPDQLTVAQYRVDGFTLNRLRPYTSWEQILPIALRVWRTYTEIAQPEFVSRVALRYINRLELPVNIDFDDFLEAGPVIPPDLPQFLSSFRTRLRIHDPEAGLTANVNQVNEEEPPGSTHTVVILDIDAYKTQDLAPLGTEIEATLNALRHYKNRIFFGSITEQTARLFE